MDDFKAIVKILAAIRATEEKSVFDEGFVSEEALGITKKKRDILTYKLYKAGYVEGVFVIDDMNNQTEPIIKWDRGKPYVTLAGLLFIQENSTIRKAMKAVIDEFVPAAASATVTILMNTLRNML